MAKPLGEQVVYVRQDSLGNYDISYGINGISRVEQHSHHAIPVVSNVAVIPEERAVLSVHDTPAVSLAKAEHLAVHRATELSHLVSNVAVPTVQVAEIPILRSHVNVVPSITHASEVVAAVPQVSAVVAPEARHVVVH